MSSTLWFALSIWISAFLAFKLFPPPPPFFFFQIREIIKNVISINSSFFFFFCDLCICYEQRYPMPKRWSSRDISHRRLIVLRGMKTGKNTQSLFQTHRACLVKVISVSFSEAGMGCVSDKCNSPKARFVRNCNPPKLIMNVDFLWRPLFRWVCLNKQDRSSINCTG